MSEWVAVREGYVTKTIRVGNVTVDVNRPVLTEAERRKREDAVVLAMTQMMRCVK